MVSKFLLAIVAALAFVATASAAAAQARGCFTPTVAGRNTVQVCVLDDDPLK